MMTLYPHDGYEPTILDSVPDMEKESNVCLFENCRNDRISGALI